ncbi:hypothetical protein NEILACOT_03201 [Neisseria lactamica ATCC 23970]|uniref:Uncharacterized protein n=1 Tax=Neisseria lactamica ATCC 23970 TaxID=546265 RepID=D0W6R0_NEILA|nr:hypothetical protein NEILACOT_03201 [Neisseria lactamica ATCC 23970]
MLCLGLPLAAPVLKVLVKVHHLRHKLQQKRLVKLPKSMALRIWKSALKVPGLVANLLYVL